MKNLVSLLIFILLLGCSEDETGQLFTPLGIKYYRLVQVDYDGTIEYHDPIIKIDNPNKIVENFNSDNSVSSNGRTMVTIQIDCETVEIRVSVDGSNHIIVIDDGTHDGSIVIDGDTYNPDSCGGGTCTWIISNGNIIPERSFSTNGNTYWWEVSEAFICDSLPIVLGYFTGEPLDNGTNYLEYQTIQEWDSDYIAIQRSDNGMDGWEELTQIPSTNTNSPVTYSYIDNRK